MNFDPNRDPDQPEDEQAEDEQAAELCDQLVDEVEGALMGSYQWRIQFTRVQNYELTFGPGQDGKRLYMAGRMQHDLEYYTEFITEIGELFERIVVDIDVSPPDGTIEVVLDETLPST